MLTPLRRGRLGGLGAAILLSAAVVPVWVQIAAAHRAHWVGVGWAPGDGFWPGFVVPWATRIWALLGVVALAGWAATDATSDPRARMRRLSSVGLGAAGGVIVALAGGPGFSWLARLDVADEGVLGWWSIGALAMVTSGAVAGLVGGRAPAVGALVGAVCGGAWLAVA